MDKLELTFTYEKETKNTIRYRAVAELYFKGYSSRMIAEKLHKLPNLETLHHVTVCRDIATI